MLDAPAAVLVDAHVFDDLSPADTNRVAETVRGHPLRLGDRMAAGQIDERPRDRMDA